MKIFRTIFDIILLMVVLYLLVRAIMFALGLYVAYDALKQLQTTGIPDVNQFFNILEL